MVFRPKRITLTDISMRLDYFPPSAEYGSLLTMHAAIEGVGQPTVELLPAMLPNLHIRLAGISAYVFEDGRRVPAPPVSLIGPTNSAYRMELSADLRMVAVGFLPVGWLSLVRCSASDVADDVVDGADLWGERACEIVRDRLQGMPLCGRHIGIVESLLTQSGKAHRHGVYVTATDHWLERPGELSVDMLSRELGVGRRHLQRIMLEGYGAPPKGVAMKYRALRAASWMAANGEKAFPNAVACYADQPHMNRDFRRFIGMTPGTFMRSQSGIAAATMVGRRRAGAARPLVLWS